MTTWRIDVVKGIDCRRSVQEIPRWRDGRLMNRTHNVVTKWTVDRMTRWTYKSGTKWRDTKIKNLSSDIRKRWVDDIMTIRGWKIKKVQRKKKIIFKRKWKAFFTLNFPFFLLCLGSVWRAIKISKGARR